MCDWCEGGATDLVYNGDRAVYGEINAETGVMTFTVPMGNKPAIKGSRIVNFCPMCGKPVGSTPRIRFLKELGKVFNMTISIEEIEKYAGSIGWIIAKENVPEFRFKDDKEILCYYS